MSQTVTETSEYPLDPLSGDEFTTVAAILRRDRGVGEDWRIASIELIEPTKDELREFDDGGAVPSRRATVHCLERANNATYKGVVSLTDGQIESFEHIPGVQANFTVDEFEECDRVLRAHPDVIAALKKRGITDLDNVFMDTWTYGEAVMPPEYRDRRIGWSDTWYKSEPGANPYAHPVSALHCVIDLNSMELLRIEDDGGVDAPDVMGEYVPKHVPERIRAASRREPLKPLEITQPDGPSFTLDGNLLRWQNWSLRIGFNYREGMTLHTVTYSDGDRVRPVAHRMSFAEMVVPYRDPSVDHYRRTAFDIGEWGLGFMTTSLELGCDCLGEIRYLDAVLHNSKGEPYTIPNAVCIHEEDNAVLWKHVDHDAGAEVRRMRRLTVSCHVTVANYEYLVYWRFYQDGNIECEVRATGIMVTTPVAAGQPHPNGTLIDERTYAPFHQHFIVARLDLDIDGGDNTVFMTESYAEPIGPDNPHGLSVVTRSVPLRSEIEGQQDMNFATQRAWKVVNTNVVNGLGTHPSSSWCRVARSRP
jgi:primary-amine oxidase